MTAEELIGRLTAIADDPDSAAYVKIRALEVVHRIQRDEKGAVLATLRPRRGSTSPRYPA